jgi:hypothetical protein
MRRSNLISYRKLRSGGRKKISVGTYIPAAQRNPRPVSKKTSVAQLKRYIQKTKHSIEFTKNPRNRVYMADEELITLGKRLANYENELNKRKRKRKA